MPEAVGDEHVGQRSAAGRAGPSPRRPAGCTASSMTFLSISAQIALLAARCRSAVDRLVEQRVDLRVVDTEVGVAAGGRMTRLSTICYRKPKPSGQSAPQP